jgi:hypothetical protein
MTTPNTPILVVVGWDHELKRLAMMLDYPPGVKCENCGKDMERVDRGYCIQWICVDQCSMTCLRKLKDRDCPH